MNTEGGTRDGGLVPVSERVLQGRLSEYLPECPVSILLFLLPRTTRGSGPPLTPVSVQGSFPCEVIITPSSVVVSVATPGPFFSWDGVLYQSRSSPYNP